MSSPLPVSSSNSSSLESPLPGAKIALWLLLGINLFNYIDRQVLSAVLPILELDAEIFSPSDPLLKTKLGLLTTAFLVTYMFMSPVFGWLGDRHSRWTLVGIGVILWSLASGGSGLATGFGLLLFTRCLVGIGEAAYGPVAPSMLSDLYPVSRRGHVMAWFYMAIPVGSALGFLVGGQVAGTSWGWRGAFLVVVIPGLLLGSLCMFMKDPLRERTGESHTIKDYFKGIRMMFRIRSFFCCTAGMTCTTFVLGGVAAWTPYYIFEREARFQITAKVIEKLEQKTASDGSRVIPPEIIEKLKPLMAEEVISMSALRDRLKPVLTEEETTLYNSRIFDSAVADQSMTLGGINMIFGGIVVVSGLLATLLGGILGDRWRGRYRGAYFKVAGYSTLMSFPFFLGMLFVPFPYAWIMIFGAVFGLFVNTGPMNTVLANVIQPGVRSTAFAINILIIHLFGDAISPPLIGFVADQDSLKTAFLLTSSLIVIGGLIWVWGARYLDEDTARANQG